MMYSGGHSPHDVIIAPKDYAGYIILINTGEKKDLDCRAIKVIIEIALG
jgi:hypothetical protein